MGGTRIFAADDRGSLCRNGRDPVSLRARKDFSFPPGLGLRVVQETSRAAGRPPDGTFFGYGAQGRHMSSRGRSCWTTGRSLRGAARYPYLSPARRTGKGEAEGRGPPVPVCLQNGGAGCRCHAGPCPLRCDATGKERHTIPWSLCRFPCRRVSRPGTAGQG